MSSNDALFTNAVSSASAGFISRLFTHPLDTAKARMQAPSFHQIAYKNTLDVLWRTTQQEGFRSLYRGFGAVIVGGTPGTIAYLTGYEYFKMRLTPLEEGDMSNSSTHFRIPSAAVHFCCGMLAESLACIIYVPVDVVKERLQVQHGASTSTPSLQSKTTLNYTGSMDAFRRILQNEGLRGIYKGYTATLASFGPFSALYFVFYEKLKAITQQYTHHSTSSLHQNLFCSATAGAGAAWITSPLDMAKLRLQIQRGRMNDLSSLTVSYKGVVDCLRQIFHEKGFRGLFRGAGARVIHFVPATAITMTCYEEFRIIYANLLKAL